MTPDTVELEHDWIRHKFFSQEVRLNGKLSNIDYTVGGYYSRQDTLLRAIADIRPFIPLYDTNDPVPAHTAAAFATVVAPVTPGLTVTGGIRFTHEAKDYTFYRYSLTGAVIDPAFNGLKVSYSDSVVDYRLSVDYRWNDQIMTYLTYSTGFKGGGVNPVPTTAAIALPFKPEKLKNFEGGIRTDLFGRRLRFNVSAFYDEYDDILATRLSCAEYGLSFCSLVQNVGSAHTKGVEVELSAEPVDGLKINGSFSYLDFQYKSIAASTGLSLSFVPPYVPEMQWSLGGQYKIDLGSAGSITPRIDASHQSEMYSNAANASTNRIAPYTLINGSLTWRNEAEDLSVALQVENLADKYYVLNNFDIEAFFGMIRDQPGRPRQFSLVVKKRF
ncbi:MAG: TonB-dependent receptor [Sphingomonadales bacterium]|nr:TonB-dependent receptor [Sphingomonadales bacterium]